MKAIKRYFEGVINNAFDKNEDFIRNKLVEFTNAASAKKPLRVLDMGCSDGSMTERLISNVTVPFDLYGVDILKNCKNPKVVYQRVDLESDKMPFKSGFFDVVFSNQLIEHLLNKDHFVKEIRRVLRKGGCFIVSTENIASLDNIISLLLGQEPVVQHTGNLYNTGSFLSANFMGRMTEGNKYGHKNVCSYFGLKRLFEVNGLTGVFLKSFGNINGFVEFIFPMYNRILVIYGCKI